MKGSTLITGVIGLILGLVIGIFFLSPGSETTVTEESGDTAAELCLRSVRLPAREPSSRDRGLCAYPAEN